MPEFEFEGLDIGGDSSATDDAFAEAFRRADEPDTEASTDEVTPGEEPAAEEEQERERDDQGRFVPEVTDLEEQIVEKEQELEEEEETEEVSDDPEVASFLAKYGNDPEKALRAAVELSKLQGRQGDELGQLRQQMLDLQAKVNQPAAPVVSITEQLVEELDNLAVENPQAALSRAGQVDPTGQLVDRVMDIWFATNPRQASAFQAALISQQTEQRVRQELQPLVETSAQSAEERAAIEAWNIAQAARPDLNELAPAIKDIFEARPALARAALAAETPQELADIYMDAYDLADVQRGAGNAEVRQAAQKQAAEEARTQKTKARVAKPSAVGSKPGTAGGETEVSEEDRIRSGILGAKNTDILSGFTTE